MHRPHRETLFVALHKKNLQRKVVPAPDSVVQPHLLGHSKGIFLLVCWRVSANRRLVAACFAIETGGVSAPFGVRRVDDVDVKQIVEMLTAATFHQCLYRCSIGTALSIQCKQDAQASPETQVRLETLRVHRDDYKAKLAKQSEVGGGDGGAAITSGNVTTDNDPILGLLEKEIAKLEAKAMDERSKPYTVVDYLNLPCPRTMSVKDALKRCVNSWNTVTCRTLAAMSHPNPCKLPANITLVGLPVPTVCCAVAVAVDRCVPGHSNRGTPMQLLTLAAETNLRPEDVEAVDWWGNKASPEGKSLTDACGSPTRQRSNIP